MISFLGVCYIKDENTEILNGTSFLEKADFGMEQDFSFILNMKHSPWLTYDMEGWEPLFKNRTPVSVKKGRVLFSQQYMPEGVFLIQSGRVCLSTSHPKGAEKHHIIAERGSLLGSCALLRKDMHSVTATAVSDCMVYRISSQEFLSAIRTFPGVSMHFAGFLAEMDLTLIEHLYVQSFARPHSRVIVSLINMARQHGSRTNHGIRIGVKFTHEELANLINTSRVTVSNIFADLTQRGLVKKISGHYVIRDMDFLLKIAMEEFDND